MNMSIVSKYLSITSSPHEILLKVNDVLNKLFEKVYVFVSFFPCGGRSFSKLHKYCIYVFFLLYFLVSRTSFFFSISGAQSVFDEMIRLEIEPTMKSFTLLLSAYSRMGNSSKCEEIVNHMHKFGLTPDTFILNTMLNLYGRLGHFEKMEQVLSAMENGASRPDISTYNILINIYGRAGFLEKMEELFMSLSYKNFRPDVVTWTSRLGAYSRMKQYTRCIEIFEEMIDSGCYPDGGTAKVLLSSCSSEDQIQQVTAVIRTIHKADNKRV